MDEMAESFTTEVKNEIAHSGNKNPCCAVAEITGFMRACGFVTLTGKSGPGAKLATGNAAVARRYKSLIESEYGIKIKLMVGESAAVRRSRVYELSIPPGPKTDALLAATGVMKLSKGVREMRMGMSFDESIAKRKCCRKACLKGMFLGAGEVNDPEKGYNLEIVFASEATAVAARRLINGFTDIHARVRQRRGDYVAYLKDSEQIKDVLAIIGAHAQLLRFENVRMVKEMKSRANRANNCDAANMEKALGAAERQLAAIRKIELRDGLDSLPDELVDTALTRIFHPDASLAEIGQLLSPPIGKAAVSARFMRIAAYAEPGEPTEPGTPTESGAPTEPGAPGEIAARSET
ncbi:MAG: DNA-binding protein WhiA [Clostridiales Family XIII bacterium]|jgi:DNA-binding protein WhiA|nr:DNA-binding protein WhiA [Clostridiales Family XIII bacterium]